MGRRARVVLSFASFAVGALALPGCDPPPAPAAPPVLPAEGPRVAPPRIDADDPPTTPTLTKSAPPLPPPTGDRELDALRVGFHGCRVMGLRIMPTMDGTAILHASLGAGGEVLEVTPVIVVGLPHTVVKCLVERVQNAHFDPRGGDGSLLVIPVDFRRDAKDGPVPGSAVPLPTKAI